MADYWQSYPPRKSATAPFIAAAFIQKLRDHAPHSTRLAGFVTLVISGAILLLLSGVTLTAMVLGMILLAPLILISSPIWIPLSILFFISAAVLMTVVGFSVAAAAVVFWLYRCVKGASKRVEWRSGYPEDYGRETYGGYFEHSKGKDAAPGA